MNFPFLLRMSNRIKWIAVFLILLIGNAWPFENRAPDENLGLSLVALYQGDEDQAREYLSKSDSANAKAILRKLKGRNQDKNRTITMDIHDPTFICFYYYIKKLSKDRKYDYFKHLVNQIDKSNPNRDIGEPGLFYNAHFSPRGTYLIIYSSRRTLVLRSATGELMETFSLGSEGIGSLRDVHIVYSADESRRLKGMQTNEATIVTCENTRNNQITWQKTLKDRTEAYFSRDYRNVILIDYKADSNLSYIKFSWLDIETGKILSQRLWKLRNRRQGDDLLAAHVAEPVVHFPTRDNSLLNTDSVIGGGERYSFTGSRVCGYFSLREGNRNIRDIRFSSDIN